VSSCSGLQLDITLRAHVCLNLQCLPNLSQVPLRYPVPLCRFLMVQGLEKEDKGVYMYSFLHCKELLET